MKTTCRFPFNGNDDEIAESIMRGKYELPFDVVMSSELKDLILKLLVVNRAKRYKIQDILSHPWMRVLNFGFDMRF